MTAVAEISFQTDRGVGLPLMRVDILNHRIINWDTILQGLQEGPNLQPSPFGGPNLNIDNKDYSVFRSSGTRLRIYERVIDQFNMNLHVKATPTSPIRTLVYRGYVPMLFGLEPGGNDDVRMTIDAEGNVDLPVNSLQELYASIQNCKYDNMVDYPESVPTLQFFDGFAYDIRDPTYMQEALLTSRAFGDAYGAAEMHLRKTQGLRRSERLGYSRAEMKFAELIKPGERKAFSPLTEILSFIKPKPL